MEPAYGTHMPSSVPWDLKMSAIDSNGQASAWSQWESLCSWALGNWPIKCFVKNLRVGLEVCHLVEWCAEVVRHIQGRGYRDHPIWGRRKYEEENPWGSGGHKNSCRKETGFPRGFFPKSPHFGLQCFLRSLGVPLWTRKLLPLLPSSIVPPDILVILLMVCRAGPVMLSKSYPQPTTPLPCASFICLPSSLGLWSWQENLWNRHSWMALHAGQGKRGLFPWLKSSNQFREKYHMKSKYYRLGQARVFLYNHADMQGFTALLHPWCQ